MQRRRATPAAERDIIWELTNNRLRITLANTNPTDLDSDRSCTARLIEAARDGDGDALGELLTRYRKYLVFLARSGLHERVQAKADPSDIAQEVCLAAHGSIRDFRGESTEQFAAWLRGILTNTLAMHIRRYLGTEKRDARLEQTINHNVASATGFLQRQLVSNETSPSQHFARNEAFLQLAAALESLPDDYRQVIVLRHLEGLPFAEVARLMNRSVNSVEKLWVRSLAKLQTNMGEQ